MEELKCPACGGIIVYDENKEIIFCPYCGVKMRERKTALDKVIKHAERTQEFEEIVRQKKVKEKVEAEIRENKKNNKAIFLFILAFCLLCVVFFFGIRGENKSEEELKAIVIEIQKDVEDGKYDMALIKAEQLHWPHSDTDGKKRWDDQRKALIKTIESERRKHEQEINKQIGAPEGNSSYLIGMDYNIVRDKFVQAGFNNVQIIGNNSVLSDDPGLNKVTQVTINGDTEWSYGIGGMLRKTYKVSVPVIITYNSPKE